MLENFNIKVASICFAIVLTASCTAPSYQVARPSDASISEAVREISSAKANPSYQRNLSMREARGRVETIYARLKPSAQYLCRYLAERSPASCLDWQVAVDDDDEFNAYATGSNEIVMFKGIAERSRYDEEVAYILAHELSHHMLNHIRETGTNQLIGNVLGTLVGLAAAAWVYEGVDCNPRSQDCDYVADGIQGMVDIGSNAGTFIANRKYSVAQESEADWLTAYILSHADFSLIRAREAVVHMAVINDSTSTRSSFFDSHPVGPERLSQFDTAIQEVLSNVSGNPRAP